MNIQELLKLIKEVEVEFVDYKFVDFLGQWQHFTAPIAEYSEDLFREGIGFDGSSIRGFQPINESDMLLVPDMDTAFIDPFMRHVTLSFICDVKDPMTSQLYSRDPRTVAAKAEKYLVSTGIADTAYFGPEAEFFIFDSARFDQNQHEAYYHVDSIEGAWNRGTDEDPNLAHKPDYKGGYFPVPPVDKFQDLRSEMVRMMTRIGIQAEVQHHEVATAGQAEIDMRFNTLLKMADAVLKYKYVVKNVAWRAGHTVTFMPKPLFQDNGTGMHTHQSLWKDGQNLFFDENGYAGLSELARHYIGGILAHSPSILAFAAPTTNSYRRLVPGYEAPVTLVYSQRNRSASVRIPMYSPSPKAKRIEVRYPDPSCNPYFAFAAMLMAGLDGVENGIEPPPPVDKDLYDLTPEEKKSIQGTPGSLEEAINALENDHAYLMKGGVFTQDVIDMHINWKRENEIDNLRLRPHPAEFMMYYDV